MDRQRGSAAGWLIGTLVGLVLLAVGADIGLRLWTESWLAGEAQQALGLHERPDVDLHGFPFVIQFMDGVFDRADIEVEGFQQGGLVLERVSVEGRRVHFPRRALFGDAPEATVHAKEAEATVEVSDEAVSRYLEASDVRFSLSFSGGRVRVTGTLQGTEASAGAEVRIEGFSLVFQDVEGAGLEFSVPLPTPLPGMRYQRVEIGEGTATIAAAFDRLVLRVS
jgi:hypothetical protein